jgi:nucleotide-binding universal stress UspA family protein
VGRSALTRSISSPTLAGARVFGTIVVGSDGRDGGRDALRLAVWLRPHGDGRLVAVRVIPSPWPAPGAPAPPGRLQFAPTQAALERELGDERIAAEPLALAGTSPARALHRVAERERAGLVVVGSTSRGPIGRVLAGDDTRATVRGAGCPVAVAPRGFAPPERGRSPRIGAVGDGIPATGAAVDLATALARGAEARLEIADAAELVRLSHRVDLLVAGTRARVLAGMLLAPACPLVVVPGSG